jgi:hypothetical protein
LSDEPSALAAESIADNASVVKTPLQYLDRAMNSLRDPAWSRKAA